MRKLLSKKEIPIYAVLAVVLYFGVFASSDKAEEYTTFSVRRGALDITILEGGEVQALENQQVKSRVRGYPGTKILRMVDEGIYITEEDVENRKVLVELDSADLVEKLTNKLITFKGTQASRTEALKGHGIQINKSQSEIYGVELEMKFAKLEMEKYLGKEVTKIVLGSISTDDDLIVESESIHIENIPEPVIIDPKEYQGDLLSQSVIETDDEPPMTIEELRLSHPDIVFSEFVAKQMLGDGAANEELSKLESSESFSLEDLNKAKTELNGKKKLFARKFITAIEKKTAELKVDRHEANVDAAKKARQIFINYEFPKRGEKLMSDYIQARRKLQRTEQLALSQIAQAKAKMASSQARFNIEEKRIRDYQEQIGACIMVAERTGLVVYGGGERWGNDDPIKEGATIRERQTIITIPDMTTMAVQVNVQEADIKNIKVGQTARIRMDAFPDQKLEGEVTKVAVLPNAENRWMNPEMKVYKTTVKVKGIHEWLKPGMSAETEILIDHFEDTLYISQQSVVPRGKKLVCFVLEDGVPVEREIEVGDITVEYIIVKSGLIEGEKILLRPPEGSRRDDTVEDEIESEEIQDSTAKEAPVEPQVIAPPTPEPTKRQIETNAGASPGAVTEV